MNFIDFVQYVKTQCMYETIYEDSEDRLMLVIRMLDAYAMANKFGAVGRWPSAAIGKETLQDALTRENRTPPQPEQEPVAWFSTLPDGKLSIKIVGKPTEGNWEPLYTTPPQHKPLTDEMTKQMRERCDSYEMRGAFVDGWLSAEAAHGIKGEA